MDIKELDLRRSDFEAMHPVAKLFNFDHEKLTYFGDAYDDAKRLNDLWSTWCACVGLLYLETNTAKAQAVPEWISVEDKLPETEPNTDGVVCAVVCSLGNVYRARYMHDVDIGVDTKYWSEFAVNYNGREYEHYEINAKISHWMPLPDAPQEPAND